MDDAQTPSIPSGSEICWQKDLPEVNAEALAAIPLFRLVLKRTEAFRPHLPEASCRSSFSQKELRFDPQAWYSFKNAAVCDLVFDFLDHARLR